MAKTMNDYDPSCRENLSGYNKRGNWRHGDVELAMLASTLVRLKATGSLVAVCLVNADQRDHFRKVLYPVASIQMIDVDPDHRRRRLATRMIQRAMTIVADKRPAFDLWMEEDNREAIALYEKFDFVFTGIEDYAEPGVALYRLVPRRKVNPSVSSREG